MLNNFARLQTFGSPSLHWVKVTVDPASTSVLQLAPMIVKQPKWACNQCVLIERHCPGRSGSNGCQHDLR